jgi:hypothetical protein
MLEWAVISEYLPTSSSGNRSGVHGQCPILLYAVCQTTTSGVSALGIRCLRMNFVRLKGNLIRGWQ